GAEISRRVARHVLQRDGGSVGALAAAIRGVESRNQVSVIPGAEAARGLHRLPPARRGVREAQVHLAVDAVAQVRAAIGLMLAQIAQGVSAGGDGECLLRLELKGTR